MKEEAVETVAMEEEAAAMAPVAREAADACK